MTARISHAFVGRSTDWCPVSSHFPRIDSGGYLSNVGKSYYGPKWSDETLLINNRDCLAWTDSLGEIIELRTSCPPHRQSEIVCAHHKMPVSLPRFETKPKNGEDGIFQTVARTNLLGLWKGIDDVKAERRARLACPTNLSTLGSSRNCWQKPFACDWFLTSGYQLRCRTRPRDKGRIGFESRWSRDVGMGRS
jgi:hypothetical protein